MPGEKSNPKCTDTFEDRNGREGGNEGGVGLALVADESSIERSSSIPVGECS